LLRQLVWIVREGGQLFLAEDQRAAVRFGIGVHLIGFRFDIHHLGLGLNGQLRVEDRRRGDVEVLFFGDGKALDDDADQVLAWPERRKRVLAGTVGGVALFAPGPAHLDERAGNQSAGRIRHHAAQAGYGCGLRRELPERNQ
jgi:hypothetical protein